MESYINIKEKSDGDGLMQIRFYNYVKTNETKMRVYINTKKLTKGLSRKQKTDGGYIYLEENGKQKGIKGIEVSGFIIKEDSPNELIIENDGVVDKILFNEKGIKVLDKDGKDIIKEISLPSGVYSPSENFDPAFLIDEGIITAVNRDVAVNNLFIKRGLGGFSLPVKETGKGTIAYKETSYGKEENVFEYSTSDNRHLMRVTLNKLPSGEVEKTLEMDNADGKFANFQRMVEANPEIGEVEGDKIKVKIKDIKYNPSSEVTVSFAKKIHVEGTSYKSIDVASSSIILAGEKKADSKAIFTANEGEKINQTLPSNFFKIFSNKDIKGKNIPSQQLQAIISMSERGEDLPKGVILAKEYKLTPEASVNVLILEGKVNPSTGKRVDRTFMQMGTEVRELNSILDVDSSLASTSTDANIVFAPTSARTATGGYREGQTFQVGGIQKGSSDFAAFKADVLEYNNDPNVQANFSQENKSKTEIEEMKSKNLSNKDRAVINKSADDLEVEEQPTEAEPAEPSEPIQPDPAPAPVAPKASYRRRRRGGGFFRALKYIAYVIGIVSFVGLGAMMFMAPGVGLVQTAIMLGLGLNIATSLGSSITSDIKAASKETHQETSTETENKTQELEQDLTHQKEKNQELENTIIELTDKAEEAKNALASLQEKVVDLTEKLENATKPDNTITVPRIRVVKNPKAMAAVAAAATGTGTVAGKTATVVIPNRPKGSGPPFTKNKGSVGKTP